MLVAIAGTRSYRYLALADARKSLYSFTAMIRSAARYLVDSWAPSFGLAYRRLRDYRAVRRPATPTPFGFTLAGNATMAAGGFEKDEIETRSSPSSHWRATLICCTRTLSATTFSMWKSIQLGLAGGSGIRRLFGAATGASFLQGYRRILQQCDEEGVPIEQFEMGMRRWKGDTLAAVADSNAIT
jgi:hypothetical protein